MLYFTDINGYPCLPLEGFDFDNEDLDDKYLLDSVMNIANSGVDINHIKKLNEYAVVMACYFESPDDRMQPEKWTYYVFISSSMLDAYPKFHNGITYKDTHDYGFSCFGGDTNGNFATIKELIEMAIDMYNYIASRFGVDYLEEYNQNEN